MSCARVGVHKWVRMGYDLKVFLQCTHLCEYGCIIKALAWFTHVNAFMFLWCDDLSNQNWANLISTPLWSHTYIGDLFRGLLWRCREVTWCHMFPHSHARWTRQTRRYSLWHHRALWSLLASHTVLRVVEAKEELEIKSDHALQWLDETMISWGLRGEGLWALWVHRSAYSNLNSAQSLSHWTWTHLSKVRTWCH